MGTNKERIEQLEVGLGGVQDGLHRMELGMTDRLRQMEETLNRLSNVLLANQEVPNHHQEGHDGGREANQWWQWIRRTFQEEGRALSWENFEDELWARFGPSECEDFDEALSRIKQSGSLREYQREFERLGNRVRGWTQKALIGTFMGGLRTDISDGIRMFKPQTLKEAISFARMRDDQLARQRRFIRSPPPVRGPLALPPLNRTAPTAPVALVRRLSWEEMQRKRLQGLCFNCNERFTAGHKCQGPRILMLEGDDEDANVICDGENEEPTGEEIHEGPIDPTITLHALTGWTAPKTMRVAARIGAHNVITLVDSGSTHNFISERMANLLRLPVIPTKTFTVRVANGENLKCHGRFDQVPVNLQGIKFSLTLYALPLTGLDLVLGIQWLELLGSVVCNWKKMTMEFSWGNQTRLLVGIDGQDIQAATLKELSKGVCPGHTIFAMCMQVTNKETQNQIHPSMQAVLQEFSDVFTEPSSLPHVREIDHSIPLREGTEPVNVRPYRYAHYQKDEIEKQVQEMLNSGLVQPSTSPFSSPVLLVKKKDGNWRFCTDYRALNAATIKDRFPIPTVEDMLDELYGATYFTKLDLRAGYHQVRVNPLDIPKTAFRTHNGHYEYLVMPFGLCNAPSTFQAVMNSIFRPHLRKFILVFFDDILIYSPNWGAHLEHVRQALEILRQHQFFAKASKCAFGLQEMEYLGHIVTNQGVEVDKNKIAAMVAWPRPTNISDLRGFLGLTGYYRKFVQNYGIIARPLTNLLKKGQFGWTEEAETAFLALKQAMTSTPTLAMPNFNDSFTIETDASGDGIGARVATPEQQKWVAKLLGYDYEILYRPGRENSAADALSRKQGSPILHGIFIPQASLWEEIKQAAATDPYVNSKGRLATDQPNGPYKWRHGLLLFKDKVVIPDDRALREKLLHEIHDTKMGGHSGVLRTCKRLRQQFYWPGMHKSLQEYIKACEVCQKVKTETLNPAGLLQPLPIPCRVWDDISLDFIEGLPISQGKDTIMVVVDRLSKSAHFLTLTHPFTAKTVADKFVEGIVKLHGMPQSVISDRDPIFISKFWQEFFKMSGTKLQLSSAYHPQTDGQTEVVNRCLEQYLRCFVHQWPRKWSSYLPWAEYWYNTTYHSSTGMTPFQALYGRLPPAIPSYTEGLSPVHEVDQQLLNRDEILQQLKSNLASSINRMKQIADTKRRAISFDVGERVLLKLHPYRQQTAFKRAHQKLATRFYGPYEILQKCGPVAYKLKLPEGSRIHPVFHVSLLKQYREHDGHKEPTPLPPISDEGIIELEPQAILDTRWIKHGGQLLEESLVQRKHLPTEEATWEPTTALLDKFSHTILEDKDPLVGGSTDKPRRSSRVHKPNPKYLG
ncbi:uncharacterized protein LOC118348436 [Juglans regia]|uniref:Uncharacterized protein LOC118348436 n=1 Tax=Juglans regia TaxID=51240 RepID=A0A6P9ETQ8_JUGRE|nr:uncharacterized protein LOC118348436 [Juglans regia]